jgi:hypothetical protein
MDPKIASREDVEDRLATGDVTAAELVDAPGRERADESLINAMGQDWVMRAAGWLDGEAYADEDWESVGVPWCEAYADAYSARAAELAALEQDDE